MLFRWFVGLSMDAPVSDVTVFTKNRERLLAGDIAVAFLLSVMGEPAVKRLLSNEHFSVDGTLIDAWASMKNFRCKYAATMIRLDLGATPRGIFAATSAATRRMPRPPLRMPGCIVSPAANPHAATGGTG
jgi:hypothetical protein